MQNIKWVMSWTVRVNFGYRSRGYIFFNLFLEATFSVLSQLIVVMCFIAPWSPFGVIGTQKFAVVTPATYAIVVLHGAREAKYQIPLMCRRAQISTMLTTGKYSTAPNSFTNSSANIQQRAMLYIHTNYVMLKGIHHPRLKIFCFFKN